MAVTNEFIEQVSEALDNLGYTLETAQQSDVIDDLTNVDDNVILPGTENDNQGNILGYVNIKMSALKSYLNGAITSIQNAWNIWYGTSSTTGVRGTWGSWFTGRQSEWDNLKVEIQTATTNANNATSNAQTATTGAENVNAGIQGFTVTITDRNGVSRSVDIGFEIYRTYASISAMNADAANVPQGKFVVIATTDKTSEDNAKMYIRNASTAAQAFGFLCDLDQASSAAWADWLNNMKPLIEAAISAANQAADRVDTVIATANQDHTRAEVDHSTASSDHTTAQSDHTQAGTDHTNATTQISILEAWNTHQPYIGNDNYWYIWNPSTNQYVQSVYAKGDDLDYTTMTPEEYQRLIDNIKEDLVFASETTCVSIIGELV